MAESDVPDYSLSDPDVLAFILLPLVLAAALAWGAWVAWQRTGRSPAEARQAALAIAGAAAAWMGLTWLVGLSGILREWDWNPPPIAFLVVAIIVLASALAFSGFGRRLALGLPLWALVGVQAFRLPLELAMHRMYERGIMPVQMSYTGRNLDILTGITACAVAALLATGQVGRRTAALWNVLGFALLVNIVVVALLSTPRFSYFGDDQLNVWVTYVPFVWLPAVLVLAALAGHLLVFRALASSRADSAPPRWAG